MNKFIINILNLVTGTAGGQIISLALMPVLTRLVTVDEMGSYSLVLAIIMVLSSISGMRLELAVMTITAESKIKETFSAFCTVNLIITILMMLIGLSISLLFKDFPLSKVDILLASLALYFFSLSQFLSSYFTALDRFKKSAANRLVKPIITILLQIILVKFGCGEIGLIIGFVVGYALSCFIFDTNFILKNIFFLDLLLLRKTYNNFRTYFLYQAPAGVINSLSQNIANFMLISMIGAYSLGLYSLSFRMLQAPISLVSSSVRDAYFSRAKSIFESTPSLLAKDMLKVITCLLLLSGTVALIFSPFLSEIFGMLFGANWADSGKIASYLLPWFVLLFSNPPASVIANIINAQKFIFMFEISNLIIRISTLTCSWLYFHDFYKLIIHFSMAGVIMNIIYITTVYYMAKNKYGIANEKQ